MSDELTALEVAMGRPLGQGHPVALAPVRQSPRAALEAEIGRAFETGQVYISFSGGRDSSLLLAVAASVAAREGFAPPVPVTMRHSSPEADETDWQELVMRHLGLTDWILLEPEDDLDLLGARATATLERVGLTAPANAYLHLPMFESAAGGILLTGAGGDEILGARASHLVRWRHGTPGVDRRRALQSAALGAAPARIRRRWKARDLHLGGWLSRAGRVLAEQELWKDEVRVARRWDEEAAGWARSRTVELGRRALAQVASTVDARTASPLLSESFIDALAAHVGPGGPVNRTEVMRALASDLLPDAVLARHTKAAFGAMIWGPRFRDFVATWSVEDLSPDVAGLVDADGLRRAWAESEPHFATMMLAQHGWLQRRGSRRALRPE